MATDDDDEERARVLRDVARRLLPSGIEMHDATDAAAPPPLPDDFGDGFVLPEHSEKPLQRLHRHALDARLRFYAEPHVYTVDGVPTTDSVTSQAHRFEEAFDGKAAIAAMKMGRRQAWPRFEYAVDVQTFAGGAVPAGRGVMAVQGGRTVSVCHPHSVETDAVSYLKAAAVKGVDWDECDIELFSFARAMEDDEILASWSRKATLLCNQGTFAHYLAELLLNGLPSRPCGEMDVLVDFATTHLLPRGITAYNTEKEIVCLDADLAGSIDLIVYDAARKVHHLIDYKRSDKLQSQLRGYGARKMARPLDHLQDCKGAGYALQLSLYQHILERDYGMTIGDRVLVSLHPETPFCTSVPYLRAEVAYIMACRYDLVAARRAVAAAHPHLRCGLCGAPAATTPSVSTTARSPWSARRACAASPARRTRRRAPSSSDSSRRRGLRSRRSTARPADPGRSSCRPAGSRRLTDGELAGPTHNLLKHPCQTTTVARTGHADGGGRTGVGRRRRKKRPACECV